MTMLSAKIADREKWSRGFNGRYRKKVFELSGKSGIFVGWNKKLKVMARGKTLTLFLIDGDATNGIVKCSLANWTGVAYKIPRTALDRCKDIDNLGHSGVYFLFGTDENGKGVVYVGQAGVRKNGEGILNRLTEHLKNPEKDYWTEAIAFTTTNDYFGPTEISYLENRFYNLAVEAKRYEVKNGNDPNSGNPTEEKKSEMEEFIDYSKIVMGTLGHKVFDPIMNLSSEDKQSDRLLYLDRGVKNVGHFKATGVQTADGFVVFAGSEISPVDDDNVPRRIREMRKEASIVDGILQEDILLTSPSYAAVFVIGKSTNGRDEWKDKSGKTLNALEAEKEK